SRLWVNSPTTRPSSLPSVSDTPVTEIRGLTGSVYRWADRHSVKGRRTPRYAESESVRSSPQGNPQSGHRGSTEHAFSKRDAGLRDPTPRRKVITARIIGQFYGWELVNRWVLLNADPMLSTSGVMPASRTFSFSDPEAYQAAIRASSIELFPTTKG